MSISDPDFSITIAHAPYKDDGEEATSQTASTCYLDDNQASWDPNAPGPSCSMVDIGTGSHANFWSAGVTLSTKVWNAAPVGSNLPSSVSSSEVITQGTGGAPLSITMKNTGTAAWTLGTSTAQEENGTQQGTCNYDYGNQGMNDAPASGSANGATCSVTATVTFPSYDLAYGGSSFSVTPSSIPVTFTNVTRTTSYTASHTETITTGCPIEAPTAGGRPAQPTTCSRTIVVPQSWSVSYSGGGYATSIPVGGSVAFPISSMTAPSQADMLAWGSVGLRRNRP